MWHAHLARDLWAGLRRHFSSVLTTREIIDFQNTLPYRAFVFEVRANSHEPLLLAAYSPVSPFINLTTAVLSRRLTNQMIGIARMF